MSKWNIEQMTGYKPISTFWEDFDIADHFGLDAIQDTYNRAFNEWQNDYKMITELCMVVNHRCWLHYDLGDEIKSKKYCDIYYELREWCLDNFKGEAFEYFYETTD